MPLTSTFVPIIALFGSPQAAPALAKVDFDSRFGDLDGCFMLMDLNSGWVLKYNQARCEERLSPCSTFKIFNALAALDESQLREVMAGVLDRRRIQALLRRRDELLAGGG